MPVIYILPRMAVPYHDFMPYKFHSGVSSTEEMFYACFIKKFRVAACGGYKLLTWWVLIKQRKKF